LRKQGPGRQLNIRLDAEECARFERVARFYGVSETAMVRMVVKMHDDVYVPSAFSTEQFAGQCTKTDSAGVRCEKAHGHAGKCGCPKALARFKRRRPHE